MSKPQTMQRLIRSTTVLALLVGSGCQQGSEEDWEHLAASPLDIDDIEHVDELPALEGEDALRRLALDAPRRDQYEFVGYAKLEGEPLWVHDAKPEGTVGEVFEAAGIKHR